MSELHTELYEAHAEQVSAAELRILSEHEPLIDFRVLTGEGLSRGRQSRVCVLEYEQGVQTHRVLWKRMGAGKELTRAEAAELHSRLQPYRDSLIATGWRVPRLLYTTVAELPGEHQILSYEQFIPGGDGERLLANPEEPNYRKWYLIEEVIRTLYRYPDDQLTRRELAGQELTRMPHGLDLKLANCVLDQRSNELYFVDLFGPKELDQAGGWRTYSVKLDSLPEEPLLAVCATREGAILRCWRLAEQAWPNRGRSREQLRAEFLDRLDLMPIPDEERDCITTEIVAGYPWLDQLYREHGV